MRKMWLCLLALSLVAWVNAALDVPAVSLSGTVADDAGNAIQGATVSVFDDSEKKSVSVYSQEDGTFTLPNLPPRDYRIRARLIGKEDAFLDLPADKVGEETLKLVMKPATDLHLQRPANDRLDLLTFGEEADALNFKMMCAYCHQVGTEGFRTPEEPVDWEVMLTRMDGFRGLYKHTQEGLVDRMVSTYGKGVEKTWPPYTPPSPPSGKALDAEVTEWLMGKENDAMIHDLEVGKDGLIYTVDMTNDCVTTLDPATGERVVYSIPEGKRYDSTDPPIKGPHSIEASANGDMWITLALSGEMAKFDPETKEFHVISGHVPPRKRGGYPHTLRVDQKGMVWYTDAALNSVFRLNPETDEVKHYQLLSADQVRGGGRRGESRGIVPYGIDIAPDGKVWYGKLNGQRLGRIDPEAPDGSPDQIIEWKPPVHGPRRLHVAADGLVWVPGWASGNFASFNPETEEWKVYELPHGPNSLPYALNIHPKTGEIWICGTGTDTMNRFDPKTETFVEYRLPTRVTYTREIEFDDEGNIWTCNSNYPVRHVEHGHGAVIKIAAK